MTSTDILILTLVGVLALAFLVFAGLALSVRSFTVLTELIAKLGYLVHQNSQGIQQVQTTLSANGVKEADSALMSDSPITQANQEQKSPERGD